ncbi:MAG: anti-phage-associated DUF1156 domain-containing protein [Gammaproteobacteria bacterium]
MNDSSKTVEIAGAPTPAPAAEPIAKTFIEVQFPVSKLSKESYKERKAGRDQTLTPIGKWWGRKPLIMMRATIVGLLMPATGDTQKDREIFLKILTMDAEGLWLRKSKGIPLRELYARLKPAERHRWFKADADPQRPAYEEGTTREEKTALQRLVFERLSYDEKLPYCDRPEQIDGPSDEAWQEINAHLGTSASCLPELIRELGQRRFGHVPRVGDAFCGGGSVPFEAARMGCEAYGSDLNPIAALLTWGALNIVGGGDEVAKQVREAQQKLFEAVDRQIIEWGIERNEQGWRADSYLYCIESTCPECGWKVPLAPTWVIAEKDQVIGELKENKTKRCFDVDVKNAVTKAEFQAAKQGTVARSRLQCPHCGQSTPISHVRGDYTAVLTSSSGLRPWANEDVVPRPDDVFQERLYCIRWIETWLDDEGKEQRTRHYRAPDDADLEREQKVLELLRERFADWQAKGYIPSRQIVPGDETTRLMRERGWTHWHHLFTPRQLLVHATLSASADDVFSAERRVERIISLLSVGACCNWNSRLSQWIPNLARSGGIGSIAQTFYNQALNTFLNYGVRPMVLLEGTYCRHIPAVATYARSETASLDVRANRNFADIWITDPPYADAINYHELSEFFLAWYEKHLPELFPGWYTDSKRALAIRGSGKEFRQGMVDSYRNLAAHMPDNGLQVVMFTHQNAAVWADLALILWAAGLRVTAAWTIATETESALKEGNYVQGTVLMVLRKQMSTESVFLDEIVPQVEIEVEAQLASMLGLDDKDDPNFSDADYQLAAYAAALRVLTQYQGIEELDVSHELARERRRGEESPIQQLIEDAVRTASNFLVPKGIDKPFWRRLSAEEKFYLKGLEVESHGDYRSGVFQEFARGFGVRDYRDMLQSGKANQTRLKTASEFKRRGLGGDGFGATLLRQVLFAVFRVAEHEETKQGMTWLKTEIADYWSQREKIIALARYLAGMPMPHWQRDAAAARLLAGAVENDHI